MGVLTDTFNRANSTTSLGSTDTGQAWSVANGVWGISSNRAYLVSETHSPEDLGSFAFIETGNKAMKVSANIYGMLAAGSYPGVVVRYESVNNLYLGYFEQTGNTLVIYWRNGATWVSLASVAWTWTEGDQMSLSAQEEATATRLRLSINGVEKINFAHTTAGRPQGTKAGLRDDFDAGVTTGATFDNFSVDSLATTKPDTVSIADAVSASLTLAPAVTGTVLPTMPRRAVLGAGKHQVFLYDRGGENRLGRLLGTTTVRWERQRDAISESTVILDPAQCRESALNALQRGIGRYEIVIFRNGVRVWEGPITRVTWKSSSIEVTAHDICHYLSRTAMRNAYDNRYSAENSRVAPVVTRMQVILAHELARKEALYPPINVLPYLDTRVTDVTAMTSRFTPPYFSSVWEEMDHMGAKNGLDYTVVGRRLLLNGVQDLIGRTPMLTDNDFLSDLIVTSYGMELATISAVTDGEGRWAAVGDVDDFYGEVELIHTMYGEGVDFADPDNPTAEELDALAAELRSQAQRNLAGRYPIPTVVRVPDGTALNPNAPVPIELLVPGVRVPIRTTRLSITLQQEQKLDYVKVQETKAGETVTVKLSPVPGTTPWDDSTEMSSDEEDA